jgi:hypothetical protein
LEVPRAAGAAEPAVVSSAKISADHRTQVKIDTRFGLACVVHIDAFID